MKEFSEMNLTLVGVSDFWILALYCIDDSPLQDQTKFPGCYGICANPDVSGIGNRISLYIQTILTLWMAILTPEPEDTLGAMLAAIAASFTVFVATIVSYSYNNITLHHTLITINLSNLPTVAFFAAILRLRLQPGIIPLGPKIFATPILILQFLACAISVLLGIGLNSVIGGDQINAGRAGEGRWQVAQPQCNPETEVIIFGRSLRFWETETVEEVSGMTTGERVLILVAYGIIVLLPFISSFICLYLPETGTLRTFAHAFHQEHRTPVFALGSFFVLSNIWLGILIYATETQISKNKVLPGEAIWGTGQILAMLLSIIPLLGCIKVLLLEVGNRNDAARRYIKRIRLHRLFGIRYHRPSSTTSTPGTPGLSQPSTPGRRLSKDASMKNDIEKGVSSPKNVSDGTLSPRSQSPNIVVQEVIAARKLSKRNRYEPKSPEDIVIVSPGEDSGPEDAPGSGKPRVSRQETLVNPYWVEVDNKRKSTGSIAAHNARSATGNVKTIVRPDGQMTRVLSRRSSMVSRASDREEDDRRSSRSGRRLSKRRPESIARRRDSSLPPSRMSRSEDGYWSASEGLENKSWHDANEYDMTSLRRKDPSGLEADAGVRKRGNGTGGNRNDNDDPLSKYYWDPQRGWLERK